MKDPKVFENPLGLVPQKLMSGDLLGFYRPPHRREFPTRFHVKRVRTQLFNLRLTENRGVDSRIFDVSVEIARTTTDATVTLTPNRLGIVFIKGLELTKCIVADFISVMVLDLS